MTYILNVKSYSLYYSSLDRESNYITVTNPGKGSISTAAITWRIRNGKQLPDVLEIARLGSYYILTVNEKCYKRFCELTNK